MIMANSDRLPTGWEVKLFYWKTIAKKAGVEIAWVWLYLNGFKRRVPENIKDKIYFALQDLNLEKLNNS